MSARAFWREHCSKSPPVIAFFQFLPIFSSLPWPCNKKRAVKENTQRDSALSTRRLSSLEGRAERTRRSLRPQIPQFRAPVKKIEDGKQEEKAGGKIGPRDVGEDQDKQTGPVGIHRYEGWLHPWSAFHFLGSITQASWPCQA